MKNQGVLKWCSQSEKALLKRPLYIVGCYVRLQRHERVILRWGSLIM